MAYIFYGVDKDVSGKCKATPFQMTEQTNAGKLYHRQNL